MAEIDKVIDEEIETPDTEEVDVEVESETEMTPMEELADAADQFYKNIAEDMSDEVLQRMSNQLLDDYKKDRVFKKRLGDVLYK